MKVKRGHYWIISKEYYHGCFGAMCPLETLYLISKRRVQGVPTFPPPTPLLRKIIDFFPTFFQKKFYMLKRIYMLWNGFCMIWEIHLDMFWYLHKGSVPKWSDFFGLWSKLGPFQTKRSKNGPILHSKVWLWQKWGEITPKITYFEHDFNDALIVLRSYAKWIFCHLDRI